MTTEIEKLRASNRRLIELGKQSMIDKAKLRADLASAIEALKPFDHFSKSLQEWRYPTGWYLGGQDEWPSHKPVLRRTWPADEKTANIAELYKSDFDRAAAEIAKHQQKEG